MSPIYQIKEEVRKEKRQNIKKDIPMLKIKDGLLREPIHGIIDSESCLQDMKRKLRITWVQCSNYHAVSLSIER
jgi:hypothetical protein